jgi:hypothetical protein
MKPSSLGIVFGPTLLRSETDTLVGPYPTRFSHPGHADGYAAPDSDGGVDDRALLHHFCPLPAVAQHPLHPDPRDAAHPPAIHGMLGSIYSFVFIFFFNRALCVSMLPFSFLSLLLFFLFAKIEPLYATVPEVVEQMANRAAPAPPTGSPVILGSAPIPIRAAPSPPSLAGTPTRKFVPLLRMPPEESAQDQPSSDEEETRASVAESMEPSPHVRPINILEESEYGEV